MTRTFTFFFSEKIFLVYRIIFLSVFQTMLAQETPPTVQCSNLVFTNTTATTTTISWKKGNGKYSSVFMRKGTNPGPGAILENNSSYSANTVFGQQRYQIDPSGWYCICVADTGKETVQVTGLTPGTTYQVGVFTNNFVNPYTYYLKTISTGNFAAVTTSLSTIATLSNVSLSAGALTTVFSSGTTDYIANVPNAVSSIMLTPVTTDTQATVKVNGVAVTSGNPSQVIGNLEVNNVDAKANRIAIEVTAQDGTVKTYTIKVLRLLAPPTIQATNLTFTKTTGTSTTLNWTNGNGAARTVFMCEGATSSNPVPDNTYFKDDQTFGKGDQIGTTGWYAIVKTSEGNALTINGLSPGKTYQAMVMEFNGSPSNPFFLTTTSTANPATVTTLSNVATLSNVSLSTGVLTPFFSSETTAYTARVSNAASSITITPVTTDTHATIKVNGVAVSSGNPSQTIDNLEVNNVEAKANRIAIEVTAQDGTVKTYTIKVLRLLAPPTIQATNLTFTKTTATTTTVHCINGNGKQRMLLIRAGTGDGTTPVPDNFYFSGSTIFGLGDQIGTTGWYLGIYNSVISGFQIEGLAPGTTYQVMVMEFLDNGNYPSYLTTTSTGNPATVTTLSNVATLSNVSLSAGALTTVFSPETTAYTTKVPNGASSITLIPVTTDSHATIKVNGTAVASGNPSQKIDLASGAGTTVITIEVLAQDGTAKTYTVTVEKSSLGVVDNKMEGFVVYPNPVQKGMLYIQTKSTAVKNVEIFDMSGKMVLSVQTTKDEVAVEGLQKGVYVLKVNQEGAESTEKLVVE
ncbi:cadherin-like beta sandwich domain-containing protein [Flavobacterium lipolyticum]|uniref:Cadherin-like beta sandwich domain-containing protein n=1 Tax=Flavobacterium lipolyticum TaxID=2893754 RepID=A0ABS8LWR9_9FLAO|nr:cadherin-like beta sandwich domain-containing protein [Flavobacterium sp. F-126]MCC9017006.1 cadherin-like beta sandwich domain-containing protein [Flavobacterium sp. F-126]